MNKPITLSVAQMVISKKEYEALLADSRKLMALEGAGADNWQGYDDADVGGRMNSTGKLPPIANNYKQDMGLQLCISCVHREWYPDGDACSNCSESEEC